MFYNNLYAEKRMDICTGITDSCCCTPETNMTFQINYTPIKLKKKDILTKTENGILLT